MWGYKITVSSTVMTYLFFNIILFFFTIIQVWCWTGAENQITQKEYGMEKELSRCKIFTLNNGRGSNIKYAPYAFTEQGIYMLMTVLKGELAVTQSKMLIRTFKDLHFFSI